MNINQRKYGRPVKTDDFDGKSRNNRPSYDEIEEVLSPRSKRTPFINGKPMTNRCCYISPVHKDVEQLTEIDDNFSDLVKQQYDFDAIIHDRKKLAEFKKMLCKETAKVENSSQYAKQTSTPSYVETLDGSQWRNVDNTVELEQFLKAEKEGFWTRNQNSTNTVQIADTPRVKIIAEKFSKFTKNNVELRKLEEKVVCVEYDIFANDAPCEKPFQIMRAYFTVKPIVINNNENVKILPSTIKQTFDIADDDLGKLNEREVEIIDAKISENKPYLDDLKKVLKRKQAIYVKKKKSTLDLMSLYEMAKRDSPCLDDDFSNTNLLSKAELEEIKELITKKSASSIHGISRRTVRCGDRQNNNINVISQSIYEELVRKNVKILPSTIKQTFDIADDDLGKLNEREVEIIDAKISENKPYLDDLKKVLKRKQAIYVKKKKSTLDLMSLYEMAKRDSPCLDDDFSNTNLLSKAELEEIKELITKKSASSIHGISRRTVRCGDRQNNNINVISQSIYEELVRSDQ